MGENRKESPGKEVEVVRSCDEKRGALLWKEGDGNECTGEKEDRIGRPLREDGWQTEG